MVHKILKIEKIVDSELIYSKKLKLHLMILNTRRLASSSRTWRFLHHDYIHLFQQWRVPTFLVMILLRIIFYQLCYLSPSSGSTPATRSPQGMIGCRIGRYQRKKSVFVEKFPGWRRKNRTLWDLPSTRRLSWRRWQCRFLTAGFITTLGIIQKKENEKLCILVPCKISWISRRSSQ